MPPKNGTPPEFYYDTRFSNYWMRMDDRFIPLESRNCKLHMMKNRFFIDTEDAYGLKSGDAELVKAMEQRYIDYAGPLGGKPTGMFTTNGGKRILVTSQAFPVEPKRKAIPNLETYFQDLLGREQTEYVLMWLKVGWEALRKGRFTPGQMLALFGKPGCGKSFFHELVTQLFGGRSAKPYRYMTGQTPFNSELAGAEHLFVEDEQAKKSNPAREAFGTAIKDWTVNENISVHAKGREAITLGFFRRVTLSSNDEREDYMIMPPFKSGVAEKISLLKCGFAKLDEDRDKNINMLKTELPGLAYHLQKLTIPRNKKDSRFGVTHYHHPEILAVIGEISPEYHLQTLIDEVVFNTSESQRKHLGFELDEEGSLRATAEQIKIILLQSPSRFTVENLLGFTSACGTYLSRLEEKNPDRYQSRKNKGRTVWTIKKETNAD